jgi:hypothetical protein
LVGGEVCASGAYHRHVPGQFSLRHSRWRAWLRGNTPNFLYYRLGLVVPKVRDCGDHEWHNKDEILDSCYHCEQTRPHDAADLAGR